jgi:hemolysin activation/secretion protein
MQRLNSPILGVVFSFLIVSAATAQTLPGPADAGRIEPLEQPATLPSTQPPPMVLPDAPELAEAPESAKDIRFHLESVSVEGVFAFAPEQIDAFFAPYTNKDISLDQVWEIANNITRLYRDEGYFLSRAYVPAQEIEDGNIRIRVIEGYIGDIDAEADVTEYKVVRALFQRLLQQKPIRASQLESFMLRLNDFPGKQYVGVLMPIENGEEGAVKLAVKMGETQGQGAISIDNSGSRFLGPYQATANYQDNVYALHKTNVFVSASLPWDELKYAGFRHTIPLAPDWALELGGSYVMAEPGASLEPNQIESQSLDIELNAHYQPIRQRSHNLSFSAGINGKNTDSDVLGSRFTRDRIRALELQMDYDTSDAWSGYNYINLYIRQGIGAFGASNEGDLLLSRAEADSDFTTTGFSYIRQQEIAQNWSFLAQAAGQWSDAPLFSAEEFGYGGGRFGRAYDPSEITGDHGLAGSLEFRYRGLPLWHDAQFEPYVFYDLGKVWNKDTGGQDISASSAGGGVRANHASGVSANLGVAWPLTRDIDEPIYGNGKNPRLLMQLGYRF